MASLRRRLFGYRARAPQPEATPREVPVSGAVTPESNKTRYQGVDVDGDWQDVHHDEASEASPERFCRICYDDEDGGEMGYLFSPCKCTGSCALVHVQCLNTWRKMSENRNSAFKCDMCKYEYKLGSSEAAKLNFAQVIGYKWFAPVAALFFLACMIVVVGLVFELFGYVEDFSGIYELELSLPTRVLSTGTSIVGMCGFFIQQLFYSGFRLFFHFNNDRGGGGLMKAVAICIGIAYTYYKIYAWVSQKVREAAYDTTLAVLDVNGRLPGQRGPPPRRSRIVTEVD